MDKRIVNVSVSGLTFGNLLGVNRFVDFVASRAVLAPTANATANATATAATTIELITE